MYEKAKQVLGVSDDPSEHAMATAVAGGCATLCHEACMNPIEVVKQRMQMAASPYRGPLQCLTQTWAAEGPIAFFRSFPAQILMGLPYQCTYVMMYEKLRVKLNPDGSVARRPVPAAPDRSSAAAPSTAATTSSRTCLRARCLGRAPPPSRTHWTWPRRC